MSVSRTVENTIIGKMEDVLHCSFPSLAGLYHFYASMDNYISLANRIIQHLTQKHIDFLFFVVSKIVHAPGQVPDTSNSLFLLD